MIQASFDLGLSPGCLSCSPALHGVLGALAQENPGQRFVAGREIQAPPPVGPLLGLALTEPDHEFDLERARQLLRSVAHHPGNFLFSEHTLDRLPKKTQAPFALESACVVRAGDGYLEGAAGRLRPR